MTGELASDPLAGFILLSKVERHPFGSFPSPPGTAASKTCGLFSGYMDGGTLLGHQPGLYGLPWFTVTASQANERILQSEPLPPESGGWSGQVVGADNGPLATSN